MIDFHAFCENKLLCGFFAEQNIHNAEQQQSTIHYTSRQVIDAFWQISFSFIFNDRKKFTISFVAA